MAKEKKQAPASETNPVTAEAPVKAKKEKKKAFCPFTLEQFMRQAQPIKVQTGDFGIMYLAPKEFSTGSFGWYNNGQITVAMPDGGSVKCTWQMQIIAAGSKETNNSETE